MSFIAELLEIEDNLSLLLLLLVPLILLFMLETINGGCNILFVEQYPILMVKANHHR